MAQATAVAGVRANVKLGESPLWDPLRSVLWWVDIAAGDIFSYDPSSTSESRWQTSRTVAAVVRSTDGLLVAFEDGVGSFDPLTGSVTLLVPIEQNRPRNRFNDGAVDVAGRFWAGTMEHDGAPNEGTVYRVDPDLRCTPMIPRVSISNGIDWSLDGRLMYYVDTPTRRVDVFDFEPEAGTIANRRPFVHVTETPGRPDGITVDAEGHVWVAMFGGWSVLRYGPDGSVTGRVEVSASNVTSCAFGGPGLDELFITTATDGLTEEERDRQPHAGALFSARPGVTGRLANVFAVRT
jgi:sugar lactone lactonase YvrE